MRSFYAFHESAALKTNDNKWVILPEAFISSSSISLWNTIEILVRINSVENRVTYQPAIQIAAQLCDMWWACQLSIISLGIWASYDGMSVCMCLRRQITSEQNRPTCEETSVMFV
jgi:hypothetical protein